LYDDCPPTWSNWSPWTPCTKTCGSGGTRSQTRFCQGSKYVHDELRTCPGHDKRIIDCRPNLPKCVRNFTKVFAVDKSNHIVVFDFKTPYSECALNQTVIETPPGFETIDILGLTLDANNGVTKLYYDRFSRSGFLYINRAGSYNNDMKIRMPEPWKSSSPFIVSVLALLNGDWFIAGGETYIQVQKTDKKISSTYFISPDGSARTGITR
jgi:hypothetical protein